MIDKDFREFLLAMERMYLFRDDRDGYLTKTIDLMKKHKLKIPDYFKEYLKEKKIELKI